MIIIIDTLQKVFEFTLEQEHTIECGGGGGLESMMNAKKELPGHKKSNIYRSNTMCVRQKEHPLIKEDPEIESSIRFVRIEFYETIRAPVPRYQEMPIEAFGKLHGRAVLAAVSQPWFYQYHPYS